MTETVTDIIVSRGRAQEGLSTMVVWSLAAHAALIALMLLWPAPAAEPPKTIMTVSLGGAPGPKTGGLNQMGSRAVQAPAPEPAKPVVETPPAPKTPPMSLPDPKVRQQRARAKVEDAPPESASRTPSTGERPREGTAAVVRGTGFGTGLSSAGGNGGGVQLDVSDFCCPEYIDQMRIVILRIWEQNQGVRGSNTMKFTITRAGSVQAPQVEVPSGYVALDSASLRVLQRVMLPPLPAAFPNSTLTVHMRFDYQ